MKNKRKAPSPEIRAKGAAALAQWRAERAKAKAKGGKFFEEWQAEEELKKAQKKCSPMQAIKHFCNECVGGIRQDIKNCTATQCSLFIYRPYQKDTEE